MTRISTACIGPLLALTLIVTAVVGPINRRAALAHQGPQRTTPAVEAPARPANPSPEALLRTLDQMPLSFEANQGQFATPVHFTTRQAGGIFFFTTHEMAAVFRRTTSDSALAEDLEIEGEGEGSLPYLESETLALKVHFLGASPTVEIEGLDPLPGRVNYFSGSDPVHWQQAVPTYATILYHNLYPHTDLRYSGVGGRLKYDFLLDPGAEVDRIALAYTGVEGLELNGAGQLQVRTAWGTLVEDAPLAWQEGEAGRREPVAVRYRLQPGDIVGFQVGAYDPARPLVIDPTLRYGTYVGGGSVEHGRDIAVDGEGNVLVTGSTQSSDFPTTAGAFDRNRAAGQDVYVLKLAADGSGLLFSTFVGGKESESGFGLALDGDGNPVVVGWAWSSDFPTTSGAHDTSYGGNRDAFVFKLSADGSKLLFSTFVGGSERDAIYPVQVDGDGNVILTGYTLSTDFPTTAGAYDGTHNGDKEIIVCKLSPDGSELLFSTFVGGKHMDLGRHIVLDSAGNYVVTGYTWSSDYPTTPDAYDRTHGGGERDMFLLKLSADGSTLLASTYVGGSGDERGRGLALDGQGNPVIAGYTSSSNFPTTPGAYDTTYGGAYDIYALKLSADATTLLYSTLVGGSQNDYARGMDMDASGNIFVVGDSYSSSFPTTPDAFSTKGNGGLDAVVLKLSPDFSSLLYSTFVGGSGEEQGHELALDGKTGVVITGHTKSSNFPTTSGAHDRTYNGDQDLFVFYLDGLTGQGHTLTVNVSGSGTVTRDPHKSAYQPGEQVKLTASPSPGWGFSGWSGDLSSSANPATLTMDGNRSVTATFTQNQFTLSVNVSGSGTVTRDPHKSAYQSGEQVKLTASPSPGWVFSGWSGDLSSTANPATLTMDGNKSVTATFTQDQYTLSVSVSGSGSVAKSPDQAGYHHGDQVQLTASPSAGWTFTAWSGDLTGAENPATLTIDGTKSVTATFGQNGYTLTVNVDGSGSVSRAPEQAIYVLGEEVQLSATPDPGWSFSGWSGALTGAENPATVIIGGDEIVTAAFTQKEHTLTVSITGSGDVTKAPDQASYHYGDQVQLTASPGAGWLFAGWSGDLSGGDNPASLTIDGDKVATAIFGQTCHTLSTEASPEEGGSISVDYDPNCDDAGVAKYVIGTVVQLTASPAPGRFFSHWSGDVTGNANPTSLSVSADASVLAHFQETQILFLPMLLTGPYSLSFP